MTLTWTEAASWTGTQPVYKTADWVPVTQEVKTYDSGNFTRLLEEKTKKATDAMKAEMEKQIFGESPIMEYLKKKEAEEEDMDDAVRKAIEKRKEARAELVLAFLDRNWGEPEFGETHTWSAVFSDTPHKEYHYAAIFCDNSRWYVTNYVGNFTHEELKAFIADVCIRAEVYFNGELVA